MKELFDKLSSFTGLEYKILHIITISVIGLLVQGFYQHCMHGINLYHFTVYICLSLCSSIMYYKVFHG